MKRVSFSTLGCRVNQYESEAMAEKFIKEGYEIADFNEVCDAYVINTCTVTNMGDKKSRQMVTRAIRKNPKAVVAVVGCYSQIAPDKVCNMEGVSVVLGSRNKGDIVYYVNKVMETGEKVKVINPVLKDKVFEDLSVEEYQDKVRAFLKIQDGCNRFCSYCLIPFARGSVCSRPFIDIINEVNKLSKHGFKEVVLSGIHTASYGIDFKEDISLIDVIEKISTVDGIERIRIGSIDPLFFSDSLIEKIKNNSKLCPHFHLSLQSGCDETLKRMNRPYKASDYENAVNKLREVFRNVSITTDVIVGFPGETEEEFNKTYEFLKKIKLTKFHVFKYSKREGTKACQMENQVDGNVKEERSEKLIKLSKECEKEFILKLIGKKVPVLFERKVDENTYEGYTDNYIKVFCSSQLNLINEIKDVSILSILPDGESASGEIEGR